MANNFLDNYVDADGTLIHNHTADTGETYETNTGLEIKTNRVAVTNATNVYTEIIGAAIPYTTSFSSNFGVQNVTLDFHYLTDVGNTGVLLMADATPSNGLLVRVKNGKLLQLYDLASGSFTQLYSTSLGALTADTAVPTIVLEIERVFLGTQEVRLVYNGTTVHTELWKGNWEIAGTHYIYSFTAASTTTGYHIESISFDDPAVAPVLTNPTVDDTSTATTVTGTVDTDIATGTMYAYAAYPATTDIPTIKTGVSQPVTSTGTKTLAPTGLPETKYEISFVHEGDADSNVEATNWVYTDVEVYSYDYGNYTLSITATAPDTSTDTDTGTLSIVGGGSGSGAKILRDVIKSPLSNILINIVG